MRAFHAILVAATALFSPARAGTDYIYCLPDDCHEGHVPVVNAGHSAVRINPCWADANGTGVRCAECDFLIAPNVTQGVSLKICNNGTVGYQVEYWSAEPFSLHRLKGLKPVVVNSSLVNPALVVPYPSYSETYCDDNKDCGIGGTCKPGNAPRTCSLPPSPPSPPPRASPLPAPPSSHCAESVVGLWWNESTSMHEGAEYNVTSPAEGGSVTADCVHPPCTLGNATIILDSTTNAATVKFTNASTETAEMDAGCSTLSFAKQPWTWTNHRPANVTRNLDISLGTFLGGSRTGLVPVAVDWISDSVVLVAGNMNGSFTFPGVAARSLPPLAVEGGNATLVSIDVEAVKVVAVAAVGGRIDDAAVDVATGTIAIAGSMGIAAIDTTLTKVMWNDSLALVEPGVCGVCCAGEDEFCRVDIAATTGTPKTIVAAYLVGGQGPLGRDTDTKLFAAWDGRTGARVGELIEHGNPHGTDVAVIGDIIARTRFYDSNTGQEPIVIAALETTDVTMRVPHWQAWNWPGPVMRSGGLQLVADARAMRVTVGRDGQVYFAGRSDGGDSMFSRSPHDINTTANNVQTDEYTATYFTPAVGITYLARMDKEQGGVQLGQFQVARLTNSEGNTLETFGVDAAADGTVFAVQTSAYNTAFHEENKTIDGQPVGEYHGDGALLSMTKDFARRNHWTVFSSSEAPGPSRGIDVRVSPDSSKVAALFSAQGTMITKSPLKGTSAPDTAAAIQSGFLVIMPTTA